MATLPELIAMLERIGKPSDNVVFKWTEQMLCAGQQSRPTASSLVASIMDGTSIDFCGICCAAVEDFSDWMDE